MELKEGRWRKVGELPLNTRTARKYATAPEPISGAQELAQELQRATWGRVADFVGVHLDLLSAFNPEIAGSLADPICEPGPEARLYIPSAAQILFYQACPGQVEAKQVRDQPRTVAGQFPEAKARYQALGKRARVVEAARDRDEGETGDAYATYSEAFYTKNPGLSARPASGKIDGQSGERVAAWGASWKCNVFVNDALHQAGLKTPVLGNKHYATAGRMYENYTQKLGQPAKAGQLFVEIPFDKVRPGDLFVRYGGTGEASSHTEVITAKLGPTVFYASGAHLEGAYERRYVTDLAAYEEARRALVRAHLGARGMDPAQLPARELDARVFEMGEALAAAAHVKYLDASLYNFLRHKQIDP